MKRLVHELKSQTFSTLTVDNHGSTNGDLKQPITIKARDMMENKDKIEYFEYEVNQY
jgi:hypothetical protein